jgi:hypothetical protein
MSPMSANVPIASISIASILPWEFEERVFKPEDGRDGVSVGRSELFLGK